MHKSHFEAGIGVLDDQEEEYNSCSGRRSAGFGRHLRF